MAKGCSSVLLILGWLAVSTSALAQPVPAPGAGGPPFAPGFAPTSFGASAVPSVPMAVFEEPPSPPPDPGPCIHFGVEYLLWYTRKQSLPPLVTSGFIFDPIPAALGQENTSILLQGSELDAPWHTGVRLNFGIGLETDWDFAFDGSFFILEQISSGRSFAGNGDLESDVLARPFFNIVAGIPDADPVAVPGIFSGRIDVSTTRRLFGGDANLRYNYITWQNSRLVLLMGFRFVSLEEALRIQSVAEPLPGLGFLGNSLFVSDRYDTRNRFYGGQIGGEYQFRLGPVLFQTGAKVAFGAVHQTLNNTGNTQVVEGDGNVVTDLDTGLYIYPNNVGRFKKPRFAVVPEGNVKVAFDLSENIRLSVGYTFLYLSSVIRPVDQVDQNVNLQPIGDPNVIPPAAAPPPMARSNFWAHGLDFGIRFSF